MTVRIGFGRQSLCWLSMDLMLVLHVRQRCSRDVRLAMLKQSTAPGLIMVQNQKLLHGLTSVAAASENDMTGEGNVLVSASISLSLKMRSVVVQRMQLVWVVVLHLM